jgi:hypothetical protein
MRRTARLATGVVALGVIGFVGMPAATAQEMVVCDSYGRTCPVVPGEQFNRGAGTGNTVSGRTTTPNTVSGRTTTPNTLPFTGGDVVLLSLIGAGTLAGGAALVVAGRRRTPATA